MRRRRHLALAGAALTGGCLRLTGPRQPGELVWRQPVTAVHNQTSVAAEALFVCGDVRTRTVDGQETAVGGLFDFA